MKSEEYSGIPQKLLNHCEPFSTALGLCLIGAVCPIWHVSPARALAPVWGNCLIFGWDEGTLPAMPEPSGMDASLAPRTT